MQQRLQKHILEKYGMSCCKPVQTPLPPKLALSNSMGAHFPEEKDLMAKVSYLRAVGSLQYLAMMTRPDIAHSVAYLALQCQSWSRTLECSQTPLPISQGH